MILHSNPYVRLINRQHPLPEGFLPETLVDVGLPFQGLPDDPKRLLETKAGQAALSLFSAARDNHLNLWGISGYRSYQRQKELYTGSPYVAFPGTSEHQSGLALDVSCPAVSLELIPEFASTAEGQWLQKNASLFGFVLRYPKNKEHITQVPWEPWHIRYVTRPLAIYLALTGLTLEEYYEHFP